MCATEGTSREWRRKIFSNMNLFYYGWGIGTGGYLMSIKDTILLVNLVICMVFTYR